MKNLILFLTAMVTVAVFSGCTAWNDNWRAMAARQDAAARRAVEPDWDEDGR